jgi:8-oxo-dGTP diphosphatase
MATGDGNGWVSSAPGRRHWGRFGAAGLVLLRPAPPSAGNQQAQVLMQLRAGWTHEGGRWGLPGGARDSHETVAETALREAGEEAGIDPAKVRVIGSQIGIDHGVWSYTYVLAWAGSDLKVGPPTEESDALRWVDLDDVPALPLHAGLAATWPELRPTIDTALSTVPTTDAGGGAGR